MTILKWPKMLFLNCIFFIHKWLKDTNNKNKYLKIKVYYMILKIIL